MQHKLVQGTIRNLSQEGVDKTKACPSICVWFSGGLLKRLNNGIDQILINTLRYQRNIHIPRA